MPVTTNESLLPSFSKLLERADVVLIGSGIMSSTLAAMLKRLAPNLKIQVLEATQALCLEASNGWNNAGTGHAGLCEISYTPTREADGSVNVARALAIFEQFEHSKQFWSYAVSNDMVGSPKEFIHAMPHITFVHGDQDVDFLRARCAGLRQHHFFERMEFTEDPSVIGAWAPLVMEGRASTPVGATKIACGTEVDFGKLARYLLGWLNTQEGCAIAVGHPVTGLRREGHEWSVNVKCSESGETRSVRAGFVFVGAGGGTLPLLQSTGLSETAGLGGFPIGGQWLVCDAAPICDRHDAKVYGTTPPAAPSLGAPHLDLRRLDGRRQLMFGPFGSWTTRFLKHTGHWTDLFASVRPGNLSTLVRSAIHNRSLVRYLVNQAVQTMEDRMAALRSFYPAARDGDWRLVHAGIRVQAIKREDRGKIYFGNEVFRAADGTLAALLGASPGASVSVSIAFDVVRSCFPHLLSSADGQARMKQMLPTFDVDIKQPIHKEYFERVSSIAEQNLQLATPST